MFIPRSTILNNETFTPDWYMVDAENQIVGRLATQIATVLMGKHRPDYTPHVNSGDFVIVLNCDKVGFSGARMSSSLHPHFTKKMLTQRYHKFTGYPGGYFTYSPSDYIVAGQQEKIIREAVRCMLPKTKLARRMLERLRVYKGTEHPHQAQSPKPFPEHMLPKKTLKS
jgi:large subunit ribosomal protein L13